MNTLVPRLAVCAAASVLLSSAAALAATPAYKAPRNGFGQPELSGTWSNATLTRLERNPSLGDHLVPTPQEQAKLEGAQAATVQASVQPTNLKGGVAEAYRSSCDTPAGALGPGCSYNPTFYDTTLHLMRVDGQPRTSLITSPANGRIPLRPDAKTRPNAYLAGNSDNPENRGLPDRCLVSQNISTGALLNPTIYNNTYLFQQNKDAVVIVTEMSHDARTIRLNAQHDDIVRWFGDSIGHWEGDTLVVDTVHFHPEQLAYNTPALHLKERFTRVAPDRILYQFTVEDPGVYTQPWSGEYEFAASAQPQYEYACHEGNYALKDILTGAREEDARAKATGRPVQAVASAAEGE